MSLGLISLLVTGGLRTPVKVSDRNFQLKNILREEGIGSLGGVNRIQNGLG